MAFWLALESNPDVLSDYIRALGVSRDYQFLDVFSLDKDCLGFIPQPVHALIFLFPDKTKALEGADQSSMAESDDLFFVKQTMEGNACGTIALIHSILNNPDIEVDDGILKDFHTKSIDLSPEDRGKMLEANSEFFAIHQTYARQGQSNEPTEDDVDFHFIAFIHKNGNLYEIDGQKPRPVKHRDTTVETFLFDAAEICKQLIESATSEIGFNVLALVKSD